jgi:antagonist of SinR
LYKDKADSLDQEWIDLILEALDAGIALQDIEHFFQRMKHTSQAQ